jgi:hypothetical protein
MWSGQKNSVIPPPPPLPMRQPPRLVGSHAPPVARVPSSRGRGGERGVRAHHKHPPAAASATRELAALLSSHHKRLGARYAE